MKPLPLLLEYDHLFAFLVLALGVGTLMIYGLRVITRGAAHFERVNAIGGSPLLSKSLVEMGYWALMPLARGCAALGLTPNAITLTALTLGLAAGVALAFGHLGLGALLALLSALGDVLDGQVARLTKRGSKLGEVLDSSVDRYMEFFYIGGLVVFYRHNAFFVTLALLALLASFMVSYSSAKAQAMNVTLPRGPMRRHERSVYLISGAVFSVLFRPWLEPFHFWPELRGIPMLAALAIVAVAGNIAAVRRLLLTARAAVSEKRGP
jgi:CDP-diacylglycerol---glycerol-3-phosphate 3-phosphatidyltransferase